jgi:hypothetical protein
MTEPMYEWPDPDAPISEWKTPSALLDSPRAWPTNLSSSATPASIERRVVIAQRKAGGPKPAHFCAVEGCDNQLHWDNQCGVCRSHRHWYPCQCKSCVKKREDHA